MEFVIIDCLFAYHDILRKSSPQGTLGGDINSPFVHEIPYRVRECHLPSDQQESRQCYMNALRHAPLQGGEVHMVMMVNTAMVEAKDMTKVEWPTRHS